MIYVVCGYFEHYLTYLSPCKFSNSLEMGNFRTNGA